MRTYAQASPAAHALDVVGDRWALLVVRELLLGPKRFNDLRRGLPTITPAVLSQRLRELVERGVVVPHEPPTAPVALYALSPWGAELEPVLRALTRWGTSRPDRAPLPGTTGPDAALLGVRARYTSAGPPWTATVALRTAEDTWCADVVDGELVGIARGSMQRPDVRIDTTTAALVALTDGLTTPAELLDDTTLLHGDRAMGERFLDAIAAPVQPGP